MTLMDGEHPNYVRVIPYVLEPRELDGLLAIGEHLANISMRLAAMMEANGKGIIKPCRELADSLIAFLDDVDGDPDLEEGADEEPALGWTLGGSTASGNDLHNLDLEDDPAEQESDADMEEGWHQPVRLDVALDREEDAL